MESSKFAAVLPLLVSGLVSKIVEVTGMDEDEAFERLYGSELYAELENEETKVWTYSVSNLYDLFESETTIGKLELPEY